MVRGIPEACEVALVGDDVINDARRDDASCEVAEVTERMRAKEGECVATPACVVPSLTRAAAMFILGSTLLALVVSTAAPASEARATRVRARAERT